MDFEFAMWQAVYLLVNPQQVYRNFAYRKQTKNQYARDDPAFLVLISIILTFTAGELEARRSEEDYGFHSSVLWNRDGIGNEGHSGIDPLGDHC